VILLGALWVAILDRLRHHGTVLTIDGPSYRVRRRQARKDTLRNDLMATSSGD
jgi:DNA replication protein DnaC